MSGISWSVLAGLMRALSLLSVMASNAKGEQVGRILSTVATLLERGEAGRLALEALCAEIDGMVAQGREPTASEWARLATRSDAAHASIQAAAGRPPVAPVGSPGGPDPGVSDPVPSAEEESEGGGKD